MKKINMAVRFFILVATSSLVFYTCKEEPIKPIILPPAKKPAIKLEVQYADFTEILLKVSASDTSDWKRIVIKRNGELVHYNNFLNRDTVIVDNGLQNNTSYAYQALLVDNGKAIDSSFVTAKTREYGSHNWRFEIDTLGEYASYASSVISFSSNDAWIAGEFRTYNKQGTDWTRDAVAHWDGIKWTRTKIEYQVNSPEYGKLVYGSNSNDVWLLTRAINHFDGNSWSLLPSSIGVPKNATASVFVMSVNSMYFVGNDGTIAYWDGNRFLNLPSPTTCRLEDVYGENEIVYIAGTSLDFGQSVILKGEKRNFVIIDTSRIIDNFFQTSSIWFKQNDSVITYAGSKNSILYRGKSIIPVFNGYQIPYCQKVRGTGINNIWYVGHFLHVMHYDGLTWKYYPEIQNIGSGIIRDLDVHENYFFAAGWTTLKNGMDKAIVIRGYKQ